MKKNYVIVAAGLGLVQLALLSTAAHAQDSVRVLNDVVVTATRSPKKQSETGRVVTVISANEISRSQGKTLPQLLNTVAGITFSGAQNAPGISTSVFLRGASNGNTLILIDGFPANNASSIDGSYDLNAFPLDQIERIEILKGSGSTLYGSDAVAGVINIITKHAQGQGLKGNIQLTGGSYNTFNQSAGINGRINKTGIAVNLSNTDSKGFSAATDTTRIADFKANGFHQRSASVNVDHQLTENLLLNGNLQVSRNSGNLPFGAFQGDNDYNYNNTLLFAGLGAKIQLSKGVLNLRMTQNTVRNNFKNLPTDNFSTFSETRNRARITNAEAVVNYGLGKHFDITSGAGYKYSKTNQYSDFDMEGYQSDPVIIANAHNSILSAYSSLFFKSAMFNMELGGRYNHHTQFGNNFTYTANPSLLLARQLKLFGTIASAFKAPSLYQLFSEYGNINLKPENTTSYEAGLDWEIIKNRLSFNTVFFKRNTKDVIYFFSESEPPYKSYYQNGSVQKDKGFETELKYNGKQVTAGVYYAYVTGKQLNTAGIETANLYRRPKSTVGANVNYQMEQFLIGLNYKYTGDRTDVDFRTFPSTIVKLKHYDLLDMHLQLSATKNLSVFGDINNLLDTKYTDWLGYNTRGINVMVGANYQFK